MDWNEVTRIETKGTAIAIKDAMIMLNQEEEQPDGPYIKCEPGEYTFEIYVPISFCAYRARIRKVGSQPTLGKKIGDIDVDHAFIGVIDYEIFRDDILDNYERYEDWTATELGDELVINFSGEIPFNNTKLLYVKSGDGDGTYACHELLEGGNKVGIECIFIP